jgi:hypothetical protein
MALQVIDIDGTTAARQGEIYFRLVCKVPEKATRIPPEQGLEIIGHSETGHHHAIAEQLGVVHYRSENPLVSYLEVGPGVDADLLHFRDHDTHNTFRFKGGGTGRVWEARKAREHTPEGWRRVED